MQLLKSNTIKTNSLMLALICSAFVAGCSESSTSENQSNEPTMTLSGEIRFSGSKPMPNVIVRLKLQGAMTTADSNGGWRITTTNSNSISESPRVDTLEFSYNGKIFLRDTISDFDRKDIKRVFDTTWSPNHIYGFFIDSRDGQEYRTIKINGSVWMAQNLNFKTSQSWWYKGSEQIDKIAAIDEALSKGAKYGVLYSWSELLSLPDSCDTTLCDANITKGKIQGLCPSGWHVASDSDWVRLLKFVDPNPVGLENIAARKLMNSYGWPTKDSSMRNDLFGFRAMPGGGRWPEGNFGNAGYMALWWTTREASRKLASSISFVSSNSYANNSGDTKTKGMSARCIQD